MAYCQLQIQDLYDNVDLSIAGIVKKSYIPDIRHCIVGDNLHMQLDRGYNGQQSSVAYKLKHHKDMDCMEKKNHNVDMHEWM